MSYHFCEIFGQLLDISIGVVTGMLGDAGIPSMLASIPSLTHIGDASIPCASPNHPPRLILATPLDISGPHILLKFQPSIMYIG